MGFNPCGCWDLKDGSIVVGIWALLYSIIQLSIFGWQTSEIRFLKDRAAGFQQSYWSQGHLRSGNPYSGGPVYNPAYDKFIESDIEQQYKGVFIVQILNLIIDFFLLGASVALIWGIHTGTKYLVWPWIPCMALSILTTLAYCGIWWAGVVDGYFLVLTIVEAVSVVINIYCFLVIVAAYNHLKRGNLKDRLFHFDTSNYNEKTRDLIIYDDQGNSQTHILQEFTNQTGVEAYNTGDQYGQDGFQNVGFDGDPNKQFPVIIDSPPDPYNHGILYDPNFQQNYIQDPNINMDTMQHHARFTQPYNHHPVNETMDTVDVKDQFTEHWIAGVPMGEPPPETVVLPPVPAPRGGGHRSTRPPDDGKDDRRSRRSSRSRSTHGGDRSRSRGHRHRNSDDDDDHHGHGHHDDSGDRRKRHHHRHHDSDDDDRTRHRSSSRRHKDRHRDSSDESDTGKKRGHKHRSSHRSRDSGRDSASDISGYTNQSRTKSRRDKRDEEDDNGTKGRRHRHRAASSGDERRRRPREVKREQKDRRDAKEEGKVTPVSQTSQNPIVPPGAISIPQHIIIPGAARNGGASDPQRYQINSEITISYQNPSNGNLSNATAVPTHRTRPSLPPAPIPASFHPNGLDHKNRFSQGESSGAESRGQGSTAV